MRLPLNIEDSNPEQIEVITIIRGPKGTCWAETTVPDGLLGEDLAETLSFAASVTGDGVVGRYLEGPPEGLVGLMGPEVVE